MQTAVETRCGASASNFSRGCNQLTSAVKPFGLDDNIAIEKSDGHIYDDLHHPPCVARNPIREESSALVHGRNNPCIDWLPQAVVTGTPQVEDDRGRSEHVTVECKLSIFLAAYVYTWFAVHALHMALTTHGVPTHFEMRIATIHMLYYRFRKWPCSAWAHSHIHTCARACTPVYAA